MLHFYTVKVKNLAFDTLKIITNAWFSMKNYKTKHSTSVATPLLKDFLNFRHHCLLKVCADICELDMVE